MPKDKKSFASDVVKKSQNKNKEMGGGRLTLNLRPDDMQLWQAWASKFGNQRGAQMTAFRAMLESAVKQGDISKQQVLDWIEKNAQ